MKTPLILLATTLVLAGCSTAPAELNVDKESQKQSTASEEALSTEQKQEDYLNQVQKRNENTLGINNEAFNSLDIKACEKHTSSSVKQSCEFQVIMTMSAAGDKSLCDKLLDPQDIELCNN